MKHYRSADEITPGKASFALTELPDLTGLISEPDIARVALTSATDPNNPIILPDSPVTGVVQVAAEDCGDYAELRGDGDWLPNEGETTTRSEAPQASQVSIFNDFYFSPWRMHNLKYWACQGPFRPNGMYEHDTVYDKTDAEIYPGEVLSWSSNLAGGAYYDNVANLPFLDDEDEAIYSVGTANSWDLQKDFEYWTSISTTRGDANTDVAQVISQQGRSVPATCNAPACQFPSSAQCPVDFFGHEAPGTTYWSTIGDVNNHCGV